MVKGQGKVSDTGKGDASKSSLPKPGQGEGTTQEERVEVVVPHGTKSKDLIAALESRLAHVEDDVKFVGNQVDELGQSVEGLEAEDAAIHDAVRILLTQVEDKLRGEFMGELARQRRAHEEELNDALTHMEELRADLIICKRALASGVGNSSGTSEARQQIEVPKPMCFAGSRSAREVDNFLWGLEQYFAAVGITDEDAKVRAASLYLTDIAMLWWRRRKGDIERGICTMDTFADFTRELKRQFYPENAEDEARARLRHLRHKGPIREYIKEFTNIVLEIPDLPDKEALFNFIDGLQGWAKTELRRHGVRDLATAIATAESLTDYTSSKDQQAKRPSDEESSQGINWGAKGQRNERRSDTQSATGRDKGKREDVWASKKRTDTRASDKPRDNRCFLCDGPH